jgi:arginyl-tRNA synthetase
MDSLATQLDRRVGAHLGADPLIRSSDHADFQSNGALAAGSVRRVAPRQLAAVVASALPADAADLVVAADVAGPGFVNITLADAAIWRQVAARAADGRLGVARPLSGTRIVVDYSQPNIAKEMHVGHLRSTVIGDAIVRLFRHLGADVIRQNHLGDWGTPFGMLIAYLDEHPDAATADGGDGEAAITWLSALYRAARAVFDADPEFVERARAKVVALQSGDPAALATWRSLVAESHRYFTEVYDLLGVELTEADAVGESFYNNELAGIADALERSGVAVHSQGALCVFFDGVTGPDGNPVPLIIRKSDGGFGYGVTDLAAARHRVGILHGDRICYVVDARQALHFRMVFDTVRRAGWLPDGVGLEHLAFGTVTGPDGKPFKTRSGQTVSLVALLRDAVERASAVVAEKSGLAGDELAARAREVGIGAVKYADLSTGRTRDYVFDLDRMVSLEGNTGVYLQYAHARVRSILRKAGRSPGGGSAVAAPVRVYDGVPLEPAERRLALRLDEFDAVLAATAAAAEPHRLCAYLFELAQAVAAFWAACPVLLAPDEAVRANRLVLCAVVARTLATGLDMLGIAAPDRL